MRRTLPVTEAREKLTELVDEVNNKFEQIEITKNGKPRAIIMSADEFDSWKETMEVLSDEQLMKDIRQAEKEFREGKSIPWEQVKEELNL
mgnify:FL=1